MTTATAFRWPAGALLVRRFLADYARNPVHLLMLVLVPAAFVAGAAGSLAPLARLRRSAPGRDPRRADRLGRLWPPGAVATGGPNVPPARDRRSLPLGGMPIHSRSRY
jgi:hypothetical protein